jgi:integrase/recombinase XerD
MDRLPEVLTGEERVRLLKAPNRKCPTGLRNLCLITVMLNAGLRAAELLNLRERDITWTTGQLMVRRGKGKKDRALWLSTDDLDLLASWNAMRPQGEFFFTTLDGKRVSDRYLRAMVKRMANRAGIKKDVHPHILRHTFGTDIFRHSHDIRLTQVALGHSNLNTTMIYTFVANDQLAAEMRGFRS